MRHNESPGEWTEAVPAPRRRRWRVLLTGILAVALVATVTVVTITTAGSRLVSGTPRAEGTPGGGPAADAPHEPKQVVEIRPDRYPKSYGPVSAPDTTMMEVWGKTGYVAFTTPEIIHVTAFDLTDGEVRWKRSLNMKTVLGATTMTATDHGLLFVINFQSTSYAQFTINLDLESGEDLWNFSDGPITATGLAADRLLIYNSESDQVVGYGLKNPKEKALWAVPGDGGRVSEAYQETEAGRRLPRDEGEFTQNVGVSPNPDKDQYIVFAAMYNGALSVRKLSDGEVVAEGNAGEKMMDVVVFEDTIYVYRQTPRTLAAYSITDMATPKWIVETPLSQDGSYLEVCAKEVLCLKTVASRHSSPLHAYDATSGKLLWYKEDYLAASAVMAGDWIAISHKGGTTLLEPKSGEVVTKFTSPSYALPGDGVFIGFDSPEIKMMRPGETKATSLGEAPDDAMAAGTCEWTSEVALCAGEEDYRLWRYRG